jgi:hypothetical protein
MVLIPCVPAVGILSFYSGVPAVFLTVGYAGNVTLFRLLVMVHITSFLPSVRDLGFPLFDGEVGPLHWNIL